MSLKGICFNSISSDQYRKPGAGGFGGITPEFFGPPGIIDTIMDKQLCQALDINIEGLSRDEIKANILSELTGKPVDLMLDFYINTGKSDAQININILKCMGMEPSEHPDSLMARGENKANIINGWMNQENGEQVYNQEFLLEQLAQKGSNNGGKILGPSPLPSVLISFMAFIDLSPSGNKETDYFLVMNKLDQMEQDAQDDITINSLRQSFKALYMTL